MNEPSHQSAKQRMLADLDFFIKECGKTFAGRLGMSAAQAQAIRDFIASAPDEMLASIDFKEWLSMDTSLKVLRAQADRIHAYRKWLADRADWLKDERHKGGDWKYLLQKEEETRYCLEKLDKALSPPEALPALKDLPNV